jgi:hypothetical protein
MPPVRRHVFTFAAGLSLFLCVAVCVAWLTGALSHRAEGWVRVTHERLAASPDTIRLRIQGVTVRNGVFEIAWMTLDTAQGIADANPPSVGRSAWFFTPPGGVPPGIYRLPNGVGAGVRIPAWLVVVATGVLPLGWYCRQRARRDREARARAGHCFGCGYDLRGIPGRCPECGTERAA